MKDIEQKFLDDLVTEAAQEIHKAEEDGKRADAEALIRTIAEREKEFGIKFSRFRRSVLQKAEELRSKAKDEREKRIIKKYEDEVTVAGDKLRPAGVQEEFNIRIWAWTGKLGERIFGHKIDADGYNDLQHRIQEIEDRMERNKVQLAQLKAAREATATMIGPEWLPERLKGAISVRRAGLVKQIYEAKRRAHGGWGSRFRHLAQSYTAAGELREKSEKEYMAGRKEIFGRLEKEAGELKARKELLEKALERIRKMQEDGRAVFEQAFGDELNVLIDGRETLGQEEFEKRIAKLRDDVARFGRDAGFVRLDHFLRKSLEAKQINLPKLFGRPGKYAEPRAGVEKGRESLRLSQWWKDVFQKDPSPGEIGSLIDTLKKKDRGFLKIFSSEGYIPGETPGREINTLIRFLITGKAGDREILPWGRRAPLNPQSIVKCINEARNTMPIAGGMEGIRAAMERFALERTSGAEDFLNAIEEFSRNEPHPETREERHSLLAPILEALTGRKPDADETDRIFNSFKERHGAGTAMFIESLKTIPLDRREFLKFFYTGKFAGESHTKMDGLLYRSDDPSAFLDLLEKTEELFRDGEPGRQELQKICKRLWATARGKDGNGSPRGLPDLLRDNAGLLKDMLEAVREPDKKEETSDNVIRVEFGKKKPESNNQAQP